MSTLDALTEASAALTAALRTVAGVRVYTDPAAVVDPPAAVLGPPSLTWSALCPEPTSARFLIYVVVAADDQAMPRLWGLVPTVAAAVDALPEASVIRATPGAFTELPSYEIETEVSL